jgi:hypothetical protein
MTPLRLVRFRTEDGALGLWSVSAEEKRFRP